MWQSGDLLGIERVDFLCFLSKCSAAWKTAENESNFETENLHFVTHIKHAASRLECVYYWRPHSPFLHHGALNDMDVKSVLQPEAGQAGGGAGVAALVLHGDPAQPQARGHPAAAAGQPPRSDIGIAWDAILVLVSAAASGSSHIAATARAGH